MDLNFKADIFLFLYAQRGYDQQVKLWERCKDAFAGQLAVKSRGNLYLYQTEAKSRDNRQWEAYLGRAKFPTYPGSTLQKMLGILSSGAPGITLPDKLMPLVESATPYRDGLSALQRRVNENQLKFGRYGLLLEVNESGEPLFYINEYRAETILRAEFVTAYGESYAKFVILDESGYQFDYQTKKDVWQNKIRILGLDERGAYYQAQIDPEQYDEFNFDQPSGNVVYPDVYGKQLNRIPFTWVNVSNLSGSRWQSPPMLELINLCFCIYNDDACHEQTLFMTSEPDRTVIGGNGEKRDMRTGAGNVNFLPKDFQMHFTEFSGAGAAAQRENLDAMHKMAQDMGVSLAGIDAASNQSGIAMEIVRNAQTAALIVISETSGNAIQEQLRYAGMWLGMSKEQCANEIIYEPSKEFTRTRLSTQEIVSIITAKLNAAGQLPITWEEIRTVFVESGWGTEKDWEELRAELDAESIAVDEEIG